MYIERASTKKVSAHLIITAKLHRRSILGLDQYKEVLDTKVLVGKKGLKDNSRENISIGIKVEFNKSLILMFTGLEVGS